MEIDDRTGTDLTQDAPRDHPRTPRRPITGRSIPSDHRDVMAVQDPDEKGRVLSVRGAEKGRTDTRDRPDGSLRSDQLGIPRIEPAFRVVAKRMVTEQVSLADQAAGQLGASHDRSTDHEEGRPEAPGDQQISDCGGGGIVGSVVESESHLVDLARTVRDLAPEPAYGRRVGTDPPGRRHGHRHARRGRGPSQPSPFLPAALADGTRNQKGHGRQEPEHHGEQQP